MKKEISYVQAISRFDAEKLLMSLWELMEKFEVDTKMKLLNEITRGSLNQTSDIHCEWRRLKDPYELYMLKTWCFTETEESI